MWKRLRYDDIRHMKYRLRESIYYQSKIIPPNGFAVERDFAELALDGMITLCPGFCYDGATGAPDTKEVMRGAAFHDFICNLVDLEVLPVEYRRQGDDMFKEILLLDGFSDYKADIYHKAVVRWGEIKHGTC